MAKNKSKSLLERALSHMWLMSFLVIFSIFALMVGWQFIKAAAEKRQVRAEFNKIQVPADWERVSVRESGNYYCLDLCLTVTGEYRIKLNKEIAPDVLRSLVKKSGYSLTKEDKKCEIPDNTVGAIWYCAYQGEKKGLMISIILSPDKSSDINDLLSLAVRAQ